MNCGDYVPWLELYQVFVRHAGFVQSLAGAQDVVACVIVIVNHPEAVFFSVQENRNGIGVVVLALIHDFHMDVMTVNRAPDAPEIVHEYAAFPVCVQVVVAAQQKSNIVVHIHVGQLEIDALQPVRDVRPDIQDGIAVVVHIDGQIFIYIQLRNLGKRLLLVAQ